jgi:hypothetical protein
MELAWIEGITREEAGRYALLVEVSERRFSFGLQAMEGEEKGRRQGFWEGENGFLEFREVFSEHAFFGYPFRKVGIVNRTSRFTYVPSLLFDEKNREAHFRFMFSEGEGEILVQHLADPEITILHGLPEEAGSFLRRSFPGASIAHHTAAQIVWGQSMGDGGRMIVFRRPEGMDVCCFSDRQLLLSNYFACKSTVDAVYYAMYVYKQLKFRQKRDVVFLVGAGDELREELGRYVQNVVSCEDSEWEIQAAAI